MRKIYQYIVVFLGVLMSGFSVALAEQADGLATAGTTTQVAAPPDQIITSPTSPNMQLIKDLCPPTETLVLNQANQTWSAPKGWKTTQPSFLRTVDTFLGAQWVGVSVGQVICIYTQAGKDTFPVTLQRGLLVPVPMSGGIWSADKGGYMECKSHNIQDCPFYVQIPKPVKNIYDELNFKDKQPASAQ